MKPKFLPVLAMCIEDGVRMGYSIAHKYNDNPEEGEIVRHITEQVEHQIFEWFDFQEGEE